MAENTPDRVAPAPQDAMDTMPGSIVARNLFGSRLDSSRALVEKMTAQMMHEVSGVPRDVAVH